MYDSVCDFLCRALLLPFVLEFCLSIFCFCFCFFSIVLELVIIGGFVFWFGCSLLPFFLF